MSRADDAPRSEFGHLETRMTRTSTTLSFALAMALLALGTLDATAQPAPNANPRAFKDGLDAECRRMRDDYLERREAHGKDHQDLKAARQAFKARCGESKEMDDDERAATQSSSPNTAGGVPTTAERRTKACADIHAALKSALAKKARCGDNFMCRFGAASAYERARTAWRRNSCGELPADAKPAKG